ncbi:MAG: hypothetical protein L6Q71_07075 [Planctomycetes bacterium]|nr:hypothetical protein [Planctomycetota bacterium]NUQ34372.1 hypothetical protein [Planctomycetaceae bacterium]
MACLIAFVWLAMSGCSSDVTNVAAPVAHLPQSTAKTTKEEAPRYLHDPIPTGDGKPFTFLDKEFRSAEMEYFSPECEGIAVRLDASGECRIQVRRKATEQDVAYGAPTWVGHPMADEYRVQLSAQELSQFIAKIRACSFFTAEFDYPAADDQSEFGDFMVHLKSGVCRVWPFINKSERPELKEIFQFMLDISKRTKGMTPSWKNYSPFGGWYGR